MFLHLLIAHASPQFTSTDSTDVEFATEAWAAAEECTGWTASSHSVVTIERGVLARNYLGLASTDERGLYRIDLTKEARPEVLVHEIAHAWIKTGPTALVEGRTELLADCIVHHRPHLAPLQWDDGRELTAMPTLQSWSSQSDHGPTVNPFTRTDAYLGAARFVRLADLVLPEGSFWPKADNIGWSELDSLLRGAETPGAVLRAVLRSDAMGQRAALSDHDADGLPFVGEQLFGTSPSLFDTDGDGWWDGAAVSADTIPLPFDGTPVCTGWAISTPSTAIPAEFGGNLRGTSELHPQITITAPNSTSPSSILASLSGPAEDTSGGLWVKIDPEKARIAGLTPDTSCKNSDNFIVFAADPEFRTAVAPLSTELAAALHRATIRLHSPTSRLSVQLGGDHTSIRGATLSLSTTDLRAAHGSYEELANTAVAMRRIWDASIVERSWRDVIAVARSLRSTDPHTGLQPSHSRSVR